METVMHLLLIRFGVIAGLVVLAALVLFAVAVRLRRRGRLDEARQHAATIASGASRYLDSRGTGRGSLGGSALRLAARHLADGGAGGARPDRDRRDAGASGRYR